MTQRRRSRKMQGASRVADAGTATRRSIVRFILVALSVLSLFFYALTQVPFVEQHVVTPYMLVVAQSVSALLRATGASSVVSGLNVSVDGFHVVIVAACAGLEVMAIFVAAVLAFPAGARQKLRGIGVGLVVVYVINIARIAALCLVGSRFPSIFDQAHYYYGQALLLLATTGVWVLWISRLPYHGLTSRH